VANGFAAEPFDGSGDGAIPAWAEPLSPFESKTAVPSWPDSGASPSGIINTNTCTKRSNRILELSPPTGISTPTPLRFLPSRTLEHRKRPVVPTPVIDVSWVGRPVIVFWERRDRRCCVWHHGSGSVYLQSLWRTRPPIPHGQTVAPPPPVLFNCKYVY